ncbi:MobV family relaxase (plasmid) [Halobacillus sp. ACCC02827]|uniref:MobV family relaxase n=1 Tax=Halobacillus sp. ACCC02827 TaxID=3052090 RepID=UPI0025705C86|nr:MobV family relaxase [Halobacillus sp. ACCC02827]WJE14013.1 MobV family relaxase [Halobacillus sp. ACCC02827]
MAQYGIIRMQKMKQDAIGGIQKHNQRQGKESKNKDIDLEKSHLNYDLVNQENISYAKTIRRMTDERVSRKVRADAVLVSEFFVSASPEYMKGLSDQEQKEYFETAFNHLKDKYGEQNVLYATVHKDEATPHMHLGIVPITEDGRLSAKDYFHGKTKIRAIQDDFHKHMTTHGFEIDRGDPSEKKHKDVHQFKLDERKKELEQLSVQIQDHEARLSMYKKVANIYDPTTIKTEEVREELPVTSPETSTLFLQKGKVSIDKDDLEDLISLSNTFREQLYQEKLKSENLEKNLRLKTDEFKQMAEDFKRTQQRLSVFISDKEAEVEKTRKAMRAKVILDYREELKVELKHEIKGEFKGEIRELKKEIKKQDSVLEQAKNHILKLNEKAEYQMKNSVSKDKFYEVDTSRASLLKENNSLKKQNHDLQTWKDRMVDWGHRVLTKLPRVAESFFRNAGMHKEAARFRHDERER